MKENKDMQDRYGKTVRVGDTVRVGIGCSATAEVLSFNGRGDVIIRLKSGTVVGRRETFVCLA